MADYTFSTMGEAQDAGWMSVENTRRFLQEELRELALEPAEFDAEVLVRNLHEEHQQPFREVEGGEFSYAVRLERLVEKDGYTDRETTILTRSYSIRLTDAKNHAGGTGVYTDMFHRDDVRRGAETAREMLSS